MTKKKTYEKPTLIKLNKQIGGRGLCENNGSDDGGECLGNGYSAGGDCSTDGHTAVSTCGSDGSWPSEGCNLGHVP